MTAKKRGRPSKIDKINFKQVEILAKRGFTDVEMSDFFEVTERTWNNWKNKNSDFFQSLKNWKEIADEKVERSLYERATGYSHDEDKIFNIDGVPLIVPTKKHYPPDTVAAIFWLKNRKPSEWQDKRNQEISGKDGKPVKIESIIRKIVKPG